MMILIKLENIRKEVLGANVTLEPSVIHTFPLVSTSACFQWGLCFPKEGEMGKMFQRV